MSEKSNEERDELFDPESDLWHCSMSQYGAGQINNESGGGGVLLRESGSEEPGLYLII